MNNKEFSTITRTDIGDLIVHWTKSDPSSKNDAFTILQKILDEEKLIGGDGFIKGGYKCVCFTESPIADLVKVFTLAKLNAEKEKRHRYEPFGLAIKKQWLFKKGGRPVIYSDSKTFEQLPEELRWRYVNFNPPHIDFTWEREWRINTDTLKLDPEQCVIIVPSRFHLNKISNLYGNKWLTMPLSVLGLPANWD